MSDQNKREAYRQAALALDKRLGEMPAMEPGVHAEFKKIADAMANAVRAMGESETTTGNGVPE